LEHRVESLQDKLDLIRRRGGTSWPRQEAGPSADVADAAALLLTEDFEYVLRRSHDLLKKIERSMSLSMSLANIEQAKHGLSLNSTLFRLTIVASFYIPLSFTTSFFGMNFNELQSLSIWIFFVTSFPIFVISVVCLFIRRPNSV
jgi:Mg2+ and Co2+ transporter CorA